MCVSDVTLLYTLESAPIVIQRLWQLTELHPAPPVQPNFSPKYSKLIEQMEKDQEKHNNNNADTSSGSAQSNMK
jgi:hypothetical protein